MPVNAPHSAAKATIVGSDCVRVGRCYRGGHGGAVLPAAVEKCYRGGHRGAVLPAARWKCYRGGHGEAVLPAARWKCYRGGHGGAVLPAVHSADAGKMPETTKYSKPHQLFSPCWRRNDNRRQAFRAICRVCLPICRDCSRDLSGLFAGIVDSDENLLYFCLFIGYNL